MYETDDEVISQLHVMCPMTMIRAKRLMLFSKVCVHPTFEACKLVVADKSSLLVLFLMIFNG